MQRLALSLALHLACIAAAAAQTVTLSGLAPFPVVLDRAGVEAAGVADIRIAREIGTATGVQRAETVFSGVDLPRLLDAHGLEQLDRHAVRAATVIVVARDGYRASFSWGELFNTAAGKQAMLVLKEDGAPLPPRAGAFTLRAFGDLRPGPRHVRDVVEIRILMPQ